MDLASGIMTEIRRNPYTSVAALICLFALPVMWGVKADASESKAALEEIAEVRAEMRQQFTSSELNDVRRELFEIDLRIKTLEREGIAVDRLLYERRDILQEQRRMLEARLLELKRVGP